jgi:hypothetical protein
VHTAAASCVALLATLVVTAEPAAAASVVNHDPAFLQVYTNNVENLETPGSPGPAKCKGDWLDLIYYMKAREYSPDCSSSNRFAT